MKKRYFIKTLGCQMNIADSERIASILENLGFEKNNSFKNSNLLIFNTCSVRQSAEDRIFGLNNKMKQIKENNPKAKIILTGCMMHYSLKELKRKLPYVDKFLNIKELTKLPKILKLKPKIKIRLKDYLSINPKNFSKITAFVPISFGCNNFCTYCIVPFSRGQEYSRPTKEILKEVKNHIKNGAKEIWLLGQNVNSYGIEEKTIWANKTLKKEKPKIKKGCVTFANLLRLINKIPGKFWIRFTSPHPKDFSNDLIKAIKECKKVTPYLNLPIQSGNNEILKKMNRQYTIEQYKKLVEKIRKAIPNISLSTDIIVGFPTETKKQFNDTLKILKEINFDMAYIAKYSPRPKTYAYQFLKDNIPMKEKNRRWKKLTNLLKKITLAKNKKFIGKKVEVLIENFKKGYLLGKTNTFKTVKIKNGKDSKKLIGEFKKVKIVKAFDFGLEGKLI